MKKIKLDFNNLEKTKNKIKNIDDDTVIEIKSSDILKLIDLTRKDDKNNDI